jgi:hypothetical protein
MRANEFIVEGKKGKLKSRNTYPTPGAYKFRDKGADRTYNLNQIMKATAMADGRSTRAVDMDYESFAGKNNMAYPYTEAEHNMMKQAFNTVGDSTVHNLISDHRSLETPDTHKVSPVRKIHHRLGQ